MSYIEFKSTLIKESEIIGIGPLLRTDIMTGVPSSRLHFTLYCRSLMIPFTTDTINSFVEKEKGEKELTGFKQAYFTIYERVKVLLISGSGETYSRTDLPAAGNL